MRAIHFIILTSCLVLSINCIALESFKKQKIKVGKLSIEVEVAESPAQLEQGLMFRKTLEPNSGMLFIFESEHELNFWMKNTYVDLSIAYIDKNKKITEIIDMIAIPPDSKIYPTTYPSKKKSKYALEMNRGWFEKNKISIGTRLDF